MCVSVERGCVVQIVMEFMRLVVHDGEVGNPVLVIVYRCPVQLEQPLDRCGNKWGHPRKGTARCANECEASSSGTKRPANGAQQPKKNRGDQRSSQGRGALL